MSRIGTLAVLPLAALPAPAAPQAAGHPAPLTLDCQGFAAGHDKGTTAGRSPWKAGRAARGYADPDTGPEARSHDQPGVAVRFVFEFDGDRGRVRYPAAILPVVHGGGDGMGWWPIRDLATTDDMFGGRIALNLFNKARFTIDRRTGSLDLSGLDTNVSGRCARASTAPRLF